MFGYNFSAKKCLGRELFVEKKKYKNKIFNKKNID